MTRVWRRRLACLALVLGLAPGEGGAQSTSLLESFAEFLGLTANPGSMRGSGEGPRAGALWVADLVGGRTAPLADDRDYRSPVYLPDGDLLALAGDEVVRFAQGAGLPVPAAKAAGVDRLVAAGKGQGKVLVLVRQPDARTAPAVLSLLDGVVTALPVEPGSRADAKALAYLRAWTRDYGDVELSVGRQTRTGLAGTEEWSDVLLRRGDAEPVDVSRCDGVDCGQPSLSPDHLRVVFVKASRDY